MKVSWNLKQEWLIQILVPDLANSLASLVLAQILFT